LVIAHRTEAVKTRIKEGGGLLLILPGGTTSKAQPLDVLVNRQFKKELKDLWSAWIRAHRHEHTKAGNVKAASRGEVATWVSQAWANVTPNIIRKAFYKAGVSQCILRKSDEEELDDHDPSNPSELDCPLFQCPDTYLDYGDDEVNIDLGSLNLS
jgi:hypothetical protein